MPPPIICLAFITFTLVSVARGSTIWVESGDADTGLFFGDNQVTSGPGALTEFKAR